jgi:hypothetical protein
MWILMQLLRRRGFEHIEKTVDVKRNEDERNAECCGNPD